MHVKLSFDPSLQKSRWGRRARVSNTRPAQPAKPQPSAPSSDYSHRGSSSPDSPASVAGAGRSPTEALPSHLHPDHENSPPTREEGIRWLIEALPSSKDEIAVFCEGEVGPAFGGTRPEKSRIGEKRNTPHCSKRVISRFTPSAATRCPRRRSPPPLRRRNNHRGHISITMTLRSEERKLSFEILSTIDPFLDDDSDLRSIHRSNSDPVPRVSGDENHPSRRRRKHKRKKLAAKVSPIAEEDGFELEDSRFDDKVKGLVTNTIGGEERGSGAWQASPGELRQRSVGIGGGEAEEGKVVEEKGRVEGSVKEEVEMTRDRRMEQVNWKLETAESLDWKRLMVEDPNYTLLVEKSPVKYILEEMCHGNSLRSTTTVGNEKERERVYDTIFRLPWRCELLIDVGFYVCMDSFLSLFTIMPVRVLMTLWRLLIARKAKKLSTAELSDLSCLIVLACGVLLLGQTDISLIYHMIRGQGTIKLYVVYNVLEAITLSTCIVAHNNALMALLVSNNFAEIKSNVFKRFSKDNVHSIVYADSVERFHISAFLLFVLAQNLLEAEGAWFENFVSNALLVFICEMIIDVIKHSFIAKFNDIKPITYSEFLEDLCKQTLNIQTDGGKKNLTFVPLAPACVSRLRYQNADTIVAELLTINFKVIRVLTPVYAAHLPCSPLHLRWFWTSLLAVFTFFMLASLKVMIGMGLQKHAAWYIKRCRRRKLHSD
ncbi:POLLEN DEFECTIVE IN GUIDANCE 1-like protein [Drosera capensis]